MMALFHRRVFSETIPKMYFVAGMYAVVSPALSRLPINHRSTVRVVFAAPAGLKRDQDFSQDTQLLSLRFTFETDQQQPVFVPGQAVQIWRGAIHKPSSKSPRWRVLGQRVGEFE